MELGALLERILIFVTDLIWGLIASVVTCGLLSSSDRLHAQIAAFHLVKSLEIELN